MRISATIFFLLLSSVSFAEIHTFKCDYTTNSDQDGSHAVTDDFKLTYVIDKDLGKSYMVGKNGSVDVIFVNNEQGGANFIEKTAVGNITVTTIANDGSSVHSRNTIVFGSLVPSQYYGSCILQ